MVSGQVPAAAEEAMRAERVVTIQTVFAASNAR
jgi:hypothetical protein